MGVFHWSQVVGNYVFFDCWEQCLQSRLGSVVVSQLVEGSAKYQTCLIFHRPFPTLYFGPPEKHPVMIVYSLFDTLPMSYTVTVRGLTHKLTILDRKRACHKHY